MRASSVSRIFCLCVLIAGLSACADDVVPPDQKTFDEGAAAFDAGDYEKAFHIFRNLADNGDIAALRNVALMERKGLGTDKDPQAALDDYKEAANKGLPTAQSDLADMYLDGEAGDPDPAAALPWLERAVAANHPIAQYHLGQLYEEGKAVPKDLHKAELLYAAAAAHGVKEAVARLSALKNWPAAPPSP
ncbi:MAG TPA: tetratricopeptide repeat protein [Rhizomicrobium sp.]|nr:tetratricopeptide repeat protein [Rhizomicrobium sp.]